MIDTHVHMLPGIDDGPNDFQTSLKMLEMAIGDGIRKIILTPHLNHPSSSTNYEEDLKKIEEEFHIWRHKVQSVYPLVEFRLGYELYIDDRFMSEIPKISHLPVIENTNYILIEFDRGVSMERLSSAVYELKLKGVQPIVAHVEHYPVLLENPQWVKQLSVEGALIQFSASSYRNKAMRKFLHQIIELNALDLIATDAHDPMKRPPLMKHMHEEIADRYSDALADRFFVSTPGTVFHGERYVRPRYTKNSNYKLRRILIAASFMTVIVLSATLLNKWINPKDPIVEIVSVETTESQLSQNSTDQGNLNANDGTHVGTNNSQDANGSMDGLLRSQLDPSLGFPVNANGGQNNGGQIKDNSGSSEASGVNLTDEGVPSGDANPSDTQNSSEENKIPFYEEIVSGHINQLEALQNQYIADVDRIYNEIVDAQTFITDEKQRKNTIDNYLYEVDRLERICDLDVYEVLYAFQNDLEEYDYSVNIIEETRARYHKIKEDTKNQYIAKFDN